MDAVFFTAHTNAQKNNSKMKKQNFNEASSLELVKVNGSRFAAEVLNGNARINLTQMSQPFGRSCRPGNWLKTDEAQRYLHAISVATKIATADLLEVRQGGDPLEQGTWCRDYRIALRFAQWLSPEFSIKVDEAILGLLTASRGQARPVATGAQLRRDESPAGAAGCDRGATGASAPGGLLLRGRVYPKDRSAELGAFYAELRKWVLKEDEAAVAELAGVSPGHVAEVLAGRKPGYGVLCLLVEYATENRAAGRERVVRSAARRAEQVEELRLDFMCGVAGCDRGAMGASADKLTSKHVGTEADMRPAGAGDQRHVGVHADMRANGQQTAGSACPEVVLRPEGRRTAGSHETGQDVTDGIIDFNGMEG